ncbi:hypothetical protein [Edaphobacter aggregans]|uniref:hypothetical protein n=1 Tax=Edaphobacter aggregans TaxID=570835 RepID=UPI000551E112|nr:hypothetical protein [Edaphobacter aggregans]
MFEVKWRDSHEQLLAQLIGYSPFVEGRLKYCPFDLISNLVFFATGLFRLVRNGVCNQLIERFQVANLCSSAPVL